MMDWRDYDAVPLVASPWGWPVGVKVLLCRTWWFGYQYWRERFPHHRHVGLCFIPSLMVVLRW